MSDFRYVTKAEYFDAMEDLKSLIHKVQDEVRDKFTFRYDFIGSVARNMVTMDYASNVGYDFDVNIRVNDDDENYTAEDIKRILKNMTVRMTDNNTYTSIKSNNHMDGNINRNRIMNWMSASL